MIKDLIFILKRIYRNNLPKSLRLFLRGLLKKIIYNFRYFKFRLALLTNEKVNIILGAALTHQKDWYSTNEEWFDITNKIHWRKLFKKKQKIRYALAEHVFEHLSVDEMNFALSEIFKHIIPKGNLRIAVPDGNHPDPIYRANTGIKGIGADANDHKQFITYEFLKYNLEKTGFSVKLIEGYDEFGKLHDCVFSKKYGNIMRSRKVKTNKKNSKTGWSFIDANTSLIVDAFKN